MVDDVTESVVYGATVIILGVIILNSIGALGQGGATVSGAGDLAGNDELDPAAITIETATDTLGTALQLDGSPDSGLSGKSGQPPIGNAELCTFASIGNTSKNQTIVNADGELIIQYQGNVSNATDDQWVGLRYNRSTRESTEVTLNATNETQLRHVCLRENGTHVTLNVNGTEAVVTEGANPPNEFEYNASAFNGTIEETRLYATNLTASERQTIRTNPTAPLSNGPTPLARLLYDSRKRLGSSFDTVTVYFQDDTADVTGGTVVDGADARSSVGAEDVDISDKGRQIDDVAGGDLEGAPVAFLTYTSAGLIGGLGQSVLATIEAALAFAPVAIIALLSATALGLLARSQP